MQFQAQSKRLSRYALSEKAGRRARALCTIFDLNHVQKAEKQVVSFARSKRANVFAAQKQCFCSKRLSESKCIRALRSKHSCKSIRAKTLETKILMGGGIRAI